MGISAKRLSRKAVRTARPGVLAGIAGISLVALVVLALVGYREVYHGRIFPGVEIAGLSVGGMSSQQAETVVAGHLAVSMSSPLTVEVGNRRWTLSRRSLGARYDAASLADAALAVGRSEGPVARLVTPAIVALRPRDLDATVHLSATDWSQVLDPIARAVNRPAVDARLALSSEHAVTVIPDSPGSKLDEVGAEHAMKAALVDGATNPIQLPMAQVAPALRTADLASAQKRAAVALSGPVSVSYDGHSWTLSVDEIQAALILPHADDTGKVIPLGVDSQLIDQFVQKVAGDVNRPGQSAHLVLQPDRVAVAPSQTSRAIDEKATAARIRSAVLGTNRAVSPSVTEARPAVVEPELAAPLAAANALVGRPVELKGKDGQSWTLKPSSLLKLLAIPSDPVRQRDEPPGLDSGKLKDYVAGLAQSVDRPASNARFQYNGGQVKLIRDGTTGYQLDQTSTIELIQRAVTATDRTVKLPIETVRPTFGAEDGGKLADLTLIGKNSTSYAGSIPPRRHNVELATSMLNGVVVAPGEIFSFNREVGPQTLDRGFQVGYGIVAEANGGVKTVPSVGGGICQVSTTLFQPIFWAGYQIEERHWHAYWIAHYASHGYPGLDDTVDDVARLDFKFKNTTANPLLIQSSTDGTQVYFSIYGVPPTWTVHVDAPVVTDVVKTDRALQVQEDPTLAPGQKIYTESAEDGFTVTVHRTVDDGHGNVRDLNLRSVYAPSHNVMAVGPSSTSKPSA